MLKILSLFFPALISILIYTKRRSIEIRLTLDLLIRYAIYVLIVNWCALSIVIYILKIENVILEFLESGPFFTKYTLIAMFLAWIIPYIEEIVQKSIHISFHIEERTKKEYENSKKS